MATIQARYDASSGRYLTWWAPVLAATALQLLDEPELNAAAAADGTPVRVLDLGTGTGVLAIELLRRWPRASVVGLDGSSGMLSVAAAEADARLPSDSRNRLELVAADAAAIPFGAASFDLVVSSFVLQLVRHRPSVLREIHRVLRPGGRLAFVTWLSSRSSDRFAPDKAFEDAVDELEIDDDPEPEEARSGDFESAAAAVGQLRRARFHDARARADTLVHAYDRTRYVAFLEAYAERELFEDLDRRTRRHLRDRINARLARLQPDEFVWRPPVVFATAIRPLDKRAPLDPAP